MEKQDRRGFLKLFGLSSAAIAAAPAVANAEPTVEIVKADPPPLPEPPKGMGTMFRMPPPYRQDMMNVVNEPLWSRVRIERNEMQAEYKLFGGPNHDDNDWAETNLSRANALLSPEMYAIQKIGFVFSPGTIPALRSAFIDRYMLTLWLGRKRYWEAPLSMCFSIGEPDREKGFATLPDAGFVELDIPLVIENELYFKLQLTGKPIHPCGKITAWGVFKGLHALPI